jgi:hypothetical protein
MSVAKLDKRTLQTHIMMLNICRGKPQPTKNITNKITSGIHANKPRSISTKNLLAPILHLSK